jgi:hypothetical protein
MTYPNDIDPVSRPVDGTTLVNKASIDDLCDTVDAITTELGTVPKGGFSDVKARLVDIEADVDGKANSSHSHDTSDLVDDCITQPKIDAGAVGSGELATGCIDNANKINSGVITGDRLVAGTITATQLGEDCVGGSELADNAVHYPNVSTNYKQCFRAHRNGSGQAVSDQTVTTILFTHENWDIDARFWSNLWHPDEYGKYLLVAQVCFGNAAVFEAQAWFFGSAGGSHCWDIKRTNTSSYTVLKLMDIVDVVTPGEYWGVRVWHDRGSNATVIGDPTLTFFTGTRLLA